MNRKEGEEERERGRRDHILDCRREGRPEDDDLLDWRTKEAVTTTHARKTRNGENQEEEEIMRKYLWLVGAELDDSK